MTKGRVTQRNIDAMKPRGRREILWDDVLKGFGFKVAVSGARSFVVQYRSAGQLRRMTLGKSPPLSLGRARKMATDLLADVGRGLDPLEKRRRQQADITVAVLCREYLAEGTGDKKASTVELDRSRIERHIIPTIGTRPLSGLIKPDIQRMMRDIRDGKTAVDLGKRRKGDKARRKEARVIVTGGPGAANRTLETLGAALSYAIASGYIKSNPAKSGRDGIRKFASTKRERFLSESELARLGDAIRELEAEGTNPVPLNAIRLLALTGMRTGEVLGLTWGDLELDTFHVFLPDSKTGKRRVMLGGSAIALLEGLPIGEPDQWIFPASRGAGHFGKLQKIWTKIKTKADLPGVRPHDLRHSFASMAVNSEVTLPVVSSLLGHHSVTMSERYSHLSNDPVKRAADKISGNIAAAMAPEKPSDNVVLIKGE